MALCSNTAAAAVAACVAVVVATVAVAYATNTSSSAAAAAAAVVVVAASVAAAAAVAAAWLVAVAAEVAAVWVVTSSVGSSTTVMPSSPSTPCGMRSSSCRHPTIVWKSSGRTSSVSDTNWLITSGSRGPHVAASSTALLDGSAPFWKHVCYNHC